MEKFVEVQASSVDLAVEKALVELNTTKDKVEVEVLQKGGLFQKAEVRVTVKDNVADKLGEFLNGTLERMGLVSRAEIKEENLENLPDILDDCINNPKFSENRQAVREEIWVNYRHGAEVVADYFVDKYNELKEKEDK